MATQLICIARMAECDERRGGGGGDHAGASEPIYPFFFFFLRDSITLFCCLAARNWAARGPNAKPKRYSSIVIEIIKLAVTPARG